MSGRIIALLLAIIAVASLLFLRYGPSPAPLPVSAPALAATSPAGVTTLWIYRPSTGQWFESTGGAPRTIGPIAPFDSVPVLAVAQGRARPLAWQPRTGTWIGAGPRAVRWGEVGDAPWAGPFRSKAEVDLVVFRSSSRTWLIRDEVGATQSIAFGLPGDIAVPADYDGDGITDLGVWRPTTGTWYWRTVAAPASHAKQWGVAGDLPMAGNYVGSPAADFVVFRPSTGEWLRCDGENGRTSGIVWGTRTDVPVALDYDANGRLDLAVWRPANGTWYIRPDTLQTPTVVKWGQAGDLPLPLHPAIVAGVRR